MKVCFNCKKVILNEGKCECAVQNPVSLKEEVEIEHLSILLTKALKIMSDAHYLQYDKGGKPYALHPLAVMNLLELDGKDILFDLACRIVAILHDVIEDSDYTKQDLYDYEFPEYIVEAVDLLTKKEGLSLNKYFKEIKKNPIAKLVKLADLTHNMDTTRLKEIKQKDIDRAKKYKEKYDFLKK